MIIIFTIFIYKMAKEMTVECDFIQKSLICELPPHTLDVVLKVRTRSGEHTFREDVYTRSMKYRHWNNQMRPFRSLKKRVANIFRRRRSSSNDSWGDSTQTIINWEEEVQSEMNSSISSDWSDHLLVKERCVSAVQTQTEKLGKLAYEQ